MGLRLTEDPRFDDTLLPQDLVGWEIKSQVRPECGGRIFDYLRDPDLYDHAQPMPGALEAVEALRGSRCPAQEE